ncbi:porin family protein [Flavobacterium soli]|uniref:porin family protein n=1 Tax=Flavobacterium soli TaxID=344881 RepID=UPI000413B7B6|nr:porin family protein [Flavobacterium soli]
MKKMFRSTLLLFAMAVSTTGFAQDDTASSSTDTRENFKFGVKAGINLSNVYDEENDELVADGKVGFAGGAFIAIPFGKFIGIQPEILYSEKGFKAEGSFLGADYEFTRKTSHLDIPVHLQIKPTENLSLLVGPQFSYLLSTETEFNDNSVGSEEDINDDNYKKGVFGVSAGVDFNVDQFVISARAAWDLSKTDSDGEESSLRYKNQVIQFTVGYTFL